MEIIEENSAKLGLSNGHKGVMRVHDMGEGHYTSLRKAKWLQATWTRRRVADLAGFSMQKDEIRCKM